MGEPLRIDMKELSPWDLAEASQIIHDELGLSMTELNESPKQALAMAAFATVIARRSDPDATFDEWARKPMSCYEVVNEPEPVSGNNGAAPALSPAPGV